MCIRDSYNTTGCYNNFFGLRTGQSNTTGSNNNFFGLDVGFCNTTGCHNNFMGEGAGRCNTTGGYNNFFGDNAGQQNTTGCHNNFLSRSAGRNTTTGCHNNFFGQFAGCSNTTGKYNNFFGLEAGQFGTTGSRNNFFGQQAGRYNTGNNNFFGGYLAGRCNTTGSCNVQIGNNAQGSSATVSNEVTINNGTNFARFQGAATAWTFTSDQRDKTNIQNFNLGRDFLKNIQPRKFEWNFRHTEADKGKEATGFIAQEVQEVIEEFNVSYTNLVDTNNPDQYTLGATNFIPILVNAIKELDAENTILKTRLEALEAHVGIATNT